MLTLHHLNNSRSQRVIWLLEELGLDYAIVQHDRDINTRRAAPSLRKIHPLGKAPILTDGGQAIAETGAIFQYVIENYGDGKLEPKVGTPERIQYNYWRHFSEGSMMPYLAMKLVFARIIDNVPLFLRPLLRIILGKVNRQYLDPTLIEEMDFIEAHLGENNWFSGAEFTAADIMIGFLIEAVNGRLNPNKTYPYITNFVSRIRLRPAYIQAQQKGGFSASEFKRYWAKISL